ncbi:MAG: hypothetical protein K2J89_05665 [Clostridia bacterium]|nr:hypothetical protein [Clostridia bacterium]
MTKKRVKCLIGFLVVFLIILFSYLAFRLYLTNYMDNFPLYACRQNMGIGPIVNAPGNVNSAEVYCGDPDIKDSKKVAILYLTDTTYNSGSYAMRYIKFKSSKAAKNYLDQCDDDQTIVREIAGKYVFEYQVRNGEEGYVQPYYGTVFFDDPSFIIMYYRFFVLCDYSDLKELYNAIKYPEEE